MSRAAAALVAFGLCGPVLAAPSGTFQCRLVSGGAAVIDFSATGYRFSRLDAEGRRLPGTGAYDFRDPFILPLDGPLVTDLACTGTLASDGRRIEFRDRHGPVMTCTG